MIAHKGENVIIGSVFKPINGSFNLADYTVRCVVRNLKGKAVYELRNIQIVRNNKDNTVACTIVGDVTAKLSGLYFVSFELWARDQMVLSNEVEQLTIID